MDTVRRFAGWHIMLLFSAGLGGLTLGVVGMVAWQPRPADTSPLTIDPTAPGRVLVHALPGQEQAHRLESMLQIRRTLESNEAVLARIHASGVQQLALVNQTMQRQFNIDPNGHYLYDKDTHTIYRLSAGSSADESASPAQDNAPQDTTAGASDPQRQFHRRLDSAEEQQKFVGLYVHKQQLLESVVVFGRALQAQRRQLQECHQTLTAEFNIEPGRQYVIDSANDSVYEIQVARSSTPELTANGKGS